jgi:hypothetical protein
MKEKITWNYAGAAVCLAGAVFFIFRKESDRKNSPPQSHAGGRLGR